MQLTIRAFTVETLGSTLMICVKCSLNKVAIHYSMKLGELSKYIEYFTQYPITFQPIKEPVSLPFQIHCQEPPFMGLHCPSMLPGYLLWVPKGLMTEC